MPVVRALLACKADPNLPLSIDGRTSVYMAAQRGYNDILQLLIAKGFGDVNKARTDGMTPLMIARRKGLSATVTMLVKHGATLEAKAEEDSFCLLM